MHGRIYIILKESLKRLPIVGWGMQFNQFIFLKRNWEQDKPHMTEALQRLNKATKPMWLLLFPEGTNLAPSTRERSKNWAEKSGIKDYQHQLVPRSTGLQFCLQQLRETTHYVYDCTIAYEGVPRGEYAQDIFTINRSYFQARPPTSVNMYWRRFEISSIPIYDTKLFDQWLRARWQEKDWLIEGWYRHGKFPADTGVDRGPDGKIRRGAGHINTQVKAFQWYEFLQVFAPVGVLALVLYMFYGSLPKAFVKNMNKQTVVENVQALKTIQPSQADKRLLSRPTKKPNERKDTLPGVKNPVTIELNGSSQKILLDPASMSITNIQDIIKQVKELPSKMPHSRLLPRSEDTSDASSVVSRGTVRTISTQNTTLTGGSVQNNRMNGINGKPKNKDVARLQQSSVGKVAAQKPRSQSIGSRKGSVASSIGQQWRPQLAKNTQPKASPSKPPITKPGNGPAPQPTQPRKQAPAMNEKLISPMKKPAVKQPIGTSPQKNRPQNAPAKQNTSNASITATGATVGGSAGGKTSAQSAAKKIVAASGTDAPKTITPQAAKKPT